jgi:hypothetical protein
MGIWFGCGFVVLMAAAIVTMLVDDRQRAKRDALTHRRLVVLEREVLSLKKQIGWVDDRALTVRFAVPQPAPQLARKE